MLQFTYVDCNIDLHIATELYVPRGSNPPPVLIRKMQKNTGWKEKNGPPHTKVNFSYNKRLNLTTKFGVLGFLGIVNLQKKFGGSISKIVDFSLMSNFC